MAEKARLRRKDLKQPDEFITLSSQAIAWGREHQQWVVWGGAALVALLVIAGIATAYRGAQTRDANADLARAMSKLADNDYGAAATDLVEVSNRWPGTSVASIASLLSADAALRAGEADRAINVLGALQPTSASLPPYLQQQLLYVWGAAYEAKQQWAEAAARYNEAAQLGGPYTGAATLGEARARERAGEADRARELYRQVYEQFPDLPERDLIAAKIQL